MSNIEDFGKKIGGARKDLWKARGLIADDLLEMNELERKTHIKKDNIWLRPDWNKAIKEGTPQAVAYWQNKMRQATPPQPKHADEYDQQCYIATVTKIRDMVMRVRTPGEIDRFYEDVFRPEFIRGSDRGYYISVIPEADGVINNKLLKVVQSSYRQMQREAEKRLFGIPKEEQTYTATKSSLSIHCYDGENVTLSKDDRHPDTTVLTIQNSWSRSYSYLRSPADFSEQDDWEPGTFFVLNRNTNKPIHINCESKEEAEEYIETYARAAQEAANKAAVDKEGKDTPKRKGAFTPPQLRRVKRTGPDYRHGRHANNALFLQLLKFRGGEYGNWLSEADRQANLDMAYDALRDLARVLQIKPEDVSLNETLAIAFGARGRGGSGAGAAHYEPDRQVINLTKMSGAGCLAHEWGHALDHAIGLSCGHTELASEVPQKYKLPDAFLELMDAMKYKTELTPAEEIQKELEPKIQRCTNGLNDWLNAVKPKNLTGQASIDWDVATQRLMDRVTTFTGVEYSSAQDTKAEVEQLSQLCKKATGHVIPKDSRTQISLWARDLGRAIAKHQNAKPVERTIQTEFYKGSISFDQAFSRAGHGYWQSNCEMFARAFDCYVSDKLKESGAESTYLSGHANSYILPGPDNTRIAAFPEGEERKLINEKFDALLSYIKERGILHSHVEPPQITNAAPLRPHKPAPETYPSHFEQLSFEDLLSDAVARAEKHKGSESPAREIPSQNRG